MNYVNKTLYIPEPGKAYVSRKGLILRDPKADFLRSLTDFHLIRPVNDAAEFLDIGIAQLRQKKQDQSFRDVTPVN